ncbi:YdcF family protein [Flavobacterium sp.]|jgi:uncharacterized SAM-binding protein YcdF (DUF218 family)|uniref:YdcF family protein n=1 Tax=Flavobacterium sp. TaxID=239 RepID=UPI0037BFF426
MIFLLKKFITALLLPPTSLILLALFGLWLTRKHRQSGRTLAALALTMLLALSLPVTGNALLQSLEKTPPISEAQLQNAQAIVILGGGKNNLAPEYDNTDTVSRWTLQRLRYGAQLQRLSGLPILVTGGAPYGGRPEAEAMAESLTKDFQATTIWTENASKDTAENATFSADILKELNVSSIALVSQTWHLPRATDLFEQQGFTVYPAGTGYTTREHNDYAEWLPSAEALNKSSLALKEYLGLLSNQLFRH